MSDKKAEIALVDLSGIVYPIWHTSQGAADPNTTSIKAVERIRTLTSSHPLAAICCDGGRSFRHDISPEYKANRPEKDATLIHQLTLTIEQLAQDGYPIWTFPGFEADDVIASATTRALRDGYDVLVISSDKDLLQLVGPSVRVMQAITGSVVNADAVSQKFGVLPGQMRDYLMLVGDASDNVKGARGIGPKKAAALLAKYQSLDALYERLAAQGPAALGLTPDLVTSLREFQAAREVTQRLITLRADVDVPVSEVFAPRVAKAVAAFQPFDLDTEGDVDGLDEAMPTLGPEALSRETPSRLIAPDTAPAGSIQEQSPAVSPTDSRGLSAQLDAPPDVPVARPSQSEPRTTQAAGFNSAPPASTGMAVREPVVDVVSVPYERQLDPRNPAEAGRIAKYLFESRMFEGYGSPQAVFSTIMLGRELGIPALASLRGIHNIENKHALSATLMRGLVLKSGLAEYFDPIEISDVAVTFETKRKGSRAPVKLSHTIEMAKTAELVKEKSAWVRNPTDMLVARCTARLCRLVYPDIAGGLYTPEELAEIRDGRAA